MLVVLGIILVLITLSIPAMISSRKSARLTQCIYRMKELGAAITLYQNQFVNALPLAKASEMHWPDPIKEAEGLVDLPNIRVVLAPYIKTKVDMWRCPMQGDYRPGGTIEYRPFNSPAYRGSPDPEEPGPWVPGYWYMSNLGMIDWTEGEEAAKKFSEQLRLKDWIVRNVAGLKPVSTKTIAPVQGGRWMLMVERSSVYHSSGGADLGELDMAKGETGAFRMNALFLDGHIDTLQVRNLDDLLRQMHAPIRQKFRGKELAEQFEKQYVYPLPPREVTP